MSTVRGSVASLAFRIKENKPSSLYNAVGKELCGLAVEALTDDLGQVAGIDHGNHGGQITRMSLVRIVNDVIVKC